MAFLCALVPALPARAEGPLTGTLYEQIAGTNPFAAVILGVSPLEEDKGLGLGASPKPDSREMSDALAEFADPGRAMRQLESIKGAGGKVFAVFDYNDQGHLVSYCGVSQSGSRDFSEFRQNVPSSGWGTPSGGGRFSSFKDATRAQRVRYIARCLSSLKDMPPLKPARHELKSLYIDENSYRLAEQTFRDLGLIGEPAQYRDTFKCMVSDLGRSLEDMTGDTIVVRTSFSREVTVKKTVGDSMFTRHEVTDSFTSNWPEIVLVGVDAENGKRLAKLGADDDHFYGIWPTRGGGLSNALETTFGGPARLLQAIEACRVRYGVIDSHNTYNWSRVLSGPVPGCRHP